MGGGEGAKWGEGEREGRGQRKIVGIEGNMSSHSLLQNLDHGSTFLTVQPAQVHRMEAILVRLPYKNPTQCSFLA